MKSLYVLSQIHKAGGVTCHSKTCLHTRDCATHNSAGDFRIETGDTPKLNMGKIKPADGFALLKCEGLSDSIGALVFFNNEWIPYSEYEDYH